ncbi:hypothetical protein KJ885_03750 [Patescibacteria group bacterium]|nr:hypothetical protein [Patescibacteria group bacterium]
MYNFFHKKKEDYVNKYTIVLALVTAAIFLAGVIVMIPHTKNAVKKLIGDIPTKLKLIVILPDDCEDCFDIYQVTDFVKTVAGAKYTTTKEYKASDKNADLLIKAHGIKTLPTFVLQGNIKKLQLDQIFDPSNIGPMNDKSFVYVNKFPPYYDLEEQKIRGQFSLLFLTDNACAKCYDVNTHSIALENLVMNPTSSSTVDVSSAEGYTLISKYNIKYGPTILLRGDLDAYQNFKTLWESVGTIESDGTYIFREAGLDLMGIYKNLATWALMNTQ